MYVLEIVSSIFKKRDALKPHIVQLDECEAPGGGGRGSFCPVSLPGAIKGSRGQWAS